MVAAIADSAEREGVVPIVADLNAVAPATARASQEIAARAGCELVDGSISGPPPWNEGATDLPLGRTRGGRCGSPVRGRGDDRRRARRRIGVRGEDEHGIRLQGELGTPSPGTPRRPVERRPRARSRRPASRDTRAGRESRAAPRHGGGEVRALRRRDARDRRDTGGCRATPSLFEAVAEVYAAVARTSGPTQPRGRRDRTSLEDVLDDLR